MRLLEEFWYGNIEPTEYDTNACKEYKEVLHLITRNEEKLQATMTDEQKELFSRYNRKNCSLDIRTPFVSIRPWQSAYCSRIALSWVPE